MNQELNQAKEEFRQKMSESAQLRLQESTQHSQKLNRTLEEMDRNAK
jgi:hypothetical protein